MAKIAFFDARNDEKTILEELQEEIKFEIVSIPEKLSAETAYLAEGTLAVSVAGNNIVNHDALLSLSQIGIKYLSVRSAGYNNIDIDAARKYGIRISNVSYSPNSVADYTVMLILMSVRKIKQIILRNNIQDYTLTGLQGKEMKNLTVGIIGTGKIGEIVAKNLSGFGSKIIAYDLFPKDSLSEFIEYVSLDELLTKSDVITLHLPLDKKSHHLINKETINEMKDGVIIINCGRGQLIDTDALVGGIESGKVGAIGLDVIENELDIFHKDHRCNILTNRQLSVLRAFPNAIIFAPCVFLHRSGSKRYG
ncbi:NAD(P)-binding domain-containing protein [Pectobacterium cacticida]|uniref:NAD(P)-dependent oxidoreductase n=1 Tax=Pectobacterium cacticida TaxID=69221 RepID=A0ABZ2GFR3_9GAMM|nr:NAD(P)-dependent oxidoreductase [Pectobacterium cacticida]UYX05920.1 NAD(P)-binding domain-containing protein [Pectobacterium cacticida]